ncbi:hypothetical protein NDA18_003228 [Ustilago nuda]|nr:hypothetical protein NDA18_003228 [Ustilago nuda]
MSAGLIASAVRPGLSTTHPTDDTATITSPRTGSAKGGKVGPARSSISGADAISAVASSSRPSPKSAVDKKQDREGSASKDKERETRLPACEACRSRKVKCDALLPACTPCQKSGRECFGRDKVPNVSRGLVYELQQKVKDLESRLALASSGNSVGNTSHKGHTLAAHKGHGSGSDGRTSRVGRLFNKRQKRGQNGDHSLHNAATGDLDPDDESSTSDSLSCSSEPTEPSPNDFIQQTSTILESLSSELAGTAHRQQHQASTSRPTTQNLDNDEASALSALTRHHRDRTKSPHRLKRRSSSNASRYRDDAGSYYAGAGASRFKDASGPYPFKSRSRPGRFGAISAYDRTFFDRLIARYLTYMNTAFPVINEVRMWEIATSVYQDDERSRFAALSANSYDAMPPPSLPPSPATDRVAMSKHRYVVLMSLAIALASLGRSHNFSPELRRLGHQYWTEAQALFPMLFRFSDIDKLRATLLQLQYALLVPTSGSVWELSGAAIRLVTELNLHVDREYDSTANAPFTNETIDLRRRLFWTTYCLDRSLAVALARPPGLSDAWIHVQLPSLVSDADILRANRDQGSSSLENWQIDWQKQIFRSHINLRRVQSEVLCRLHSVNPRDYSLDNDGISLSQPAPARPSLALVMEVGPPTPNVEWQTRMMEKLAQWRSEYDRIRLVPPAHDRSQQGEGVSSTATPFITRDWIDLNHNLTISLLFRPSPNNPRPDSHGLQQAFMASGRAMKIYKSMHRSSTINFPWLATHHLFISGLTHLNALEKLTRTGLQSPSPVVEVVFNVQICASTLEALTSRDDGYGTKIRETFDAAASAVLRSVLEPGSRQSVGDGVGVGAEMVSVEEIMRGSAPSPSHVRRASDHHHEVLLQAAATQHPTWLSDSTWNTINTLDVAPPPGSTIFVAAPPRTARYTPGHSLVPTLSERTTQTTTQQQSPRGGFGMQAYTAGLNFAANASGDAFNLNHNTDGSSGKNETSNNTTTTGAGEEQAERGAAAFGFHNWLLQPYEGGADSLNFTGLSTTATSGGMLFGSPAAYTPTADTFAGMYTTASDAGQARNNAAADGVYTVGKNGVENDASTLLDFLSMLPSQPTPPSAGTGVPRPGSQSKP